MSSSSYRVYSIRWFHLFVTMILNICSSLSNFTYAPSADKAATFYNCTSTPINAFALLFFICYLFSSPIASHIIDASGGNGWLKSLIIGSLLNALGNWIRVTASINISCTEVRCSGALLSVALIGQTLSALGQPFLLNAPAALAQRWFAAEQRATATALGSMASPLGIAVAFFCVPAIVSDKAQNFSAVLVGMAVLATVAIIPLLFIRRADPPVPPSYSSERAAENANNYNNSSWKSQLNSISRDIRRALTNLEFCLILYGFGVGVGLVNTFSTIINQIVLPYSYSDDDAGIMGGLIIVGGLLSTAVMGPIIDRSRAFRTALRIAFFLTCIPLILFASLIRPNLMAVLTTFTALIGCCSFVMLPIALEVAVETTYPEVSPATASGLLWMSANSMSMILLLLCDALLQRMPSTVVLWLLVVFTCSGAVSVFFLKGKNKRMLAEQQGEQQERVLSEHFEMNHA